MFAPSVVDVDSAAWDELDAQLDTIVDALHRNSAAFARQVARATNGYSMHWFSSRAQLGPQPWTLTAGD
ncbi:hypothetical protein EN35_24840 [Rhodococcus qingshengii]|nr:hypothetical protein EN35_24840 [Rhodococcus qingshengii]